MIVVADTTPINYLILIEEIDVLARLYGRVVIPHVVREELQRSRTPVKGTVGVLQEAAELGPLDLRIAFKRLQQTTFHVSPALLAKILAEFE